MEERDEDVRDGDRQDVRPCPGSQQRHQNASKRRLPDETQADACEGDSELAYGQVFVHVGLNVLDEFCLLLSLIDELLYAENLYIATHDPEEGAYTFPYVRDTVDPSAPPGGLPLRSETLERSLTAYVIRTGQPLLATPEVLSTLLNLLADPGG